MSACEGAALVSLREAFILLLNDVPPVDSLEATYREMRPRHVLEMFDECVVDRCAAQPADERNGLRRELLRHHDAEARCDLRDKANQNWRALLDDAAFDDEPGGL